MSPSTRLHSSLERPLVMRGHQPDLFQQPVFESRTASPALDVGRFRSRMKRGMAAAIRTSHLDRHAVAERVGRIVGAAAFSKAMLDAYTSESKDHDISLVRFKALVRAIDAPDLWDLAVCDDGLLILKGDEARLAEIARLQQEKRAIAAQLRALSAAPVEIDRD